MSLLSFSAALPLLLLCFLRFSRAVCPECLEILGHLHWCTQPMEGTDTSGNLEAPSLGTPDWSPNPAIFSPLASSVQQSGGKMGVVTSSRSHSATCDICGSTFKNRLGVTIHKGRKHRNHDTHSSSTSPLPLPTLAPTQHLHKQVALGGKELRREQTLTSETMKNTTYTNNSTTTKTTAALRLSTTESCYPSTTFSQLDTTTQINTTEQFEQQPSRQLRPKRAASSLLPKREQQLLTCVCSTVCKAYVGLKSHQRSCTVFKQLLKGPTAAALTNSTGIKVADDLNNTGYNTGNKVADINNTVAVDCKIVHNTAFSATNSTQLIELNKIATSTVADVKITAGTSSITRTIDRSADSESDSDKLNIIKQSDCIVRSDFNLKISNNITVNIPVMQAKKDNAGFVPSSS